MKTNLKKPFQKKNTRTIIIIILLVIIFGIWLKNFIPIQLTEYKYTGLGLSDAEEEFITCYVKSQDEICSNYGGTIEGFKMPVCVFPPEVETKGSYELAKAFDVCNDQLTQAVEGVE